MAIKIKCEKHPRYKGEKEPRGVCAQCAMLYELVLQALVMRLKVE